MAKKFYDSNDRFSNLSLLHIERDLANIIKSEEVLDIFAQNSSKALKPYTIVIISYLKCFFYILLK